MTLHRRRRRKKVPQGDRWHTACAYAIEHPGSVYVEGWAVLYNGMTLEHGWCEVDGPVLDVEAARRHESWAAAGATYCAGLRWRWDDLAAAVAANGARLPLAWGAGGGPVYRATTSYLRAFENALRVASERRRKA